MTLWGVFVTPDDKSHVAPVDDEGFVRTPHSLDKTCECRPIHYPPDIFVHDHRERVQ
jgi:hypothetical protein